MIESAFTAPCRDAKGRFVKCPAPAAATKCRDRTTKKLASAAHPTPRGEIAEVGARGPQFTHRALVAALALLSFVCGVLAVGWKIDHERANCWREAAELDLGPNSCDR